MHISKIVHATIKSLSGVGKLLIAGAGGAFFVLSRIAKTMKTEISSVPQHFKNKNDAILEKMEEKENEKMKKNTLLAFFAVLVAIGGALGALYVYIRRREKELYEYEQLLFSEEFNNNDDFDVDAPVSGDELPLENMHFDEK